MIHGYVYVYIYISVYMYKQLHDSYKDMLIRFVKRLLMLLFQASYTQELMQEYCYVWLK